ncbi:MAG: hypothetical protein ACI8ZN_002086 [Bacteroidia bacterium]
MIAQCIQEKLPEYAMHIGKIKGNGNWFYFIGKPEDLRVLKDSGEFLRFVGL